MSKLPYLRMYVGDALSDDKLVGLSLSAWGAWIKVLFLMWKAQETPMQKTRRAWCNVFNCTEDELEDVVAELDLNDVGHIQAAGQFLTFHSPRIDADILKIRTDRDRKRVERQTDRNVERSDSVAVFAQITKWEPPIHYAEQITLRVKDLAVWESVVDAWISEGYRKTNVLGMIEKYEDEKKKVVRPTGGSTAKVCPKCKENPVYGVFGLCIECHAEIQERKGQ